MEFLLCLIGSTLFAFFLIWCCWRVTYPIARGELHIAGVVWKYRIGRIPFPYADATMLVYSLVATVMMVKHYAEQWLYWTAANVMCIYMWVLPTLDGEGSLPIVVMWTVFTINALYGLYKWYWVKENK